MSQTIPSESVRTYREPQEPSDPTHAVPGQLPLESCALVVDAKSGLARVVLTQRFVNPHAEPLSVTYKLPLPADGAISDFSFVLGARHVQGVVQRSGDARETYEQALVEGRSAALLEQERSSLFVQEIGNVPPGQTLEVRITIDHPLAWLADADHEGSWEWRFPLAAAPRYLSSDSGAGSEHFSGGATSARATLALRVRDAVLTHPESSTHSLTTAATSDGHDVALASGTGAALDRDVAVRWSVATATLSSALDARGDGLRAFGLLTVLPPARSARATAVPRDLILLLDTSGSMQGEPLAQEKRIACALIDGLGRNDTLEMFEFSNATRAFQNHAANVTAAVKKSATAWVMGLSAAGGTEMVSGVVAAMRELRSDSQRQIVLVTDGLVGFEQQIVSEVLARLPARARLHAVGVGSAVNRSLVAPIARAGRGIEALVGLGEDAERAAQRVLAATREPHAVDLRIEGSAVRTVVPARVPDVFAGAPLRVSLELEPRGGEIVIHGRTAAGPFEQRVQVAPISPNQGSAAITKRFAREQVEECEMRRSAGEPKEHIDREIERIGLELQIATCMTSWVAVSNEATVDPRAAARHVVQPHALAYGCSAEGLGLRRSAPMPMMSAMPRGGAMPAPAPQSSAGSPDSPATYARSRRVPMAPSQARAPGRSARTEADKSLFERAVGFLRGTSEGSGRAPAIEPSEGASVVGRLTTLGSGELVVEFESDGMNLDYAALEVLVCFEDGSELCVEPLLQRSTAAGFVAAPLRIRIVLAAQAQATARVVLRFLQPQRGPVIVHAAR